MREEPEKFKNGGHSPFLQVANDARQRQSDGIFHINSGIGVRNITDGTSNTLMVAERGFASGSGIWLGVVQNQFENDQVTDGSERSHSTAPTQLGPVLTQAACMYFGAMPRYVFCHRKSVRV